MLINAATMRADWQPIRACLGEAQPAIGIINCCRENKELEFDLNAFYILLQNGLNSASMRAPFLYTMHRIANTYVRTFAFLPGYGQASSKFA